MKIAFFDTETTGFIKPSLGLDQQPYCVQFAVLLTDIDGNPLGEYQTIIDNDVDIPEGASNVHGITREIARANGIPLKSAFQTACTLMGQGDIWIAHNIPFDFMVWKSMQFRAGFSESRRGYPRQFCTMNATTEICKLPGRFGKYKWPKLSEAYFHATGKELEGAHDAMVDVKACKEIFFWLKEKGKLGGLLP